ncbi:MAG: AMP-binding protein [Eggerthellaceae bacterium]|nr:AMP-binding protein [Eggerthellaceae bacterium]
MAASSADKAAFLVCDGDGQLQAIAWSAFSKRVALRADALASRNCACEAVLADGSLECVVEVFAAVEAGLQVALVDPAMPDQVAAPLLRSVDADCVWASSDARHEQLEKLLVPASAPEFGAHGVLFFTSGTTSSSKAVVLTDESLMASAFNGSSLLPLSPDDTLLCMLPLSHVFGFVCGLLWGLSCGATVALGRGMRHYADDLRVFEPTAVALVPKLLEYLVARDALNERLKLVLVGAADCPDSLLGAVRARGIRTSLGYGLTETSSGISLSIGDDFHAMTICPDDAVTIADDGEILVSAPTCLMQGYYRDEAKTASAVRNGMLHTGDKGFLDNAGLLHVEGRLKDVIGLPNGTKVFLPEYEAAVSEALGERDVAVLLDRGMLTLVCGQIARERTDRELMEAVDSAMATYPPGSRIARIVRLGHALPRTAAGDVERWKIQEELENDNC